MYYQQPVHGFTQPMPNTQFGQVPAINNYPIAAQPANTTQCGIPLAQLRNDLAAKIVNAVNNNPHDVLAMALYRSCVGDNQNWMTGHLDKLTNTLQITVDFMWRQNPQQDINQTYNLALDEVYGCAWSNQFNLHPQLQNDPAVQNSRGLINQWLNVMNQRYQQFNQAGLLTNQPVQNTGYWNTPSFQHGIPGNPGVRPIPTTTHYQNGGMQTSGYTNGYLNNGLHQQPQPGLGQVGFTTTPSRPAFNNHLHQSSSGSGLDQDDKIERLKREYAEKMKTYTGPTDKWGRPTEDVDAYSQGTAQQPVQQVQHTAQQPNNVADYVAIKERLRREALEKEASFSEAASLVQKTQTTMPYADSLNHINQIPEKPSIVQSLKQPHQTNRMPTGDATVVKYGQEQLAPTTAVEAFAAAGIPQELINQSKQMFEQSVKTGIVEHQITETDELTRIFGEMLREEDKSNPKGTKGLLDDEERCLTDKERRQLYNQGVEFEAPFRAPITAHAIHNALHAVLLKNGKVRQVITPISEGVEMRLPAHQDILAPLREDKSVQRDPNRKKHISGRLETVSTMGGVVYDRFAVSKQMLFDNLKLVLSEKDEEARNLLLAKAFDKFDEQVQKDLFDEASGRTQYRALNNIGDDEDDFEHPIFDDPEELQRRADADNRIERVEVAEEVFSVDSVGGVETATLLDDVVNNNPVTQDRSKVGTFRQTRVLHVFNNIKEAELVRQELADFYWKEEPDSTEEKERLDGKSYALRLRDRREYIPVYLWEKLNNRLTEYTNDCIRYILGIEKLRIDSFADDYEDLLTFLYKDGETKQLYLYNPRYDNLEMAVGVMDSFIVLNARCLHDVDEYKVTDEEGNEVDVINARAICAVEHMNVLSVSNLARTCGVNGNITLINQDSEYGLWAQTKEICKDAMASRNSRIKYKHPIQGMFVKFADGNTYRIFPRLGDLVDYRTRVKEDGSAEFFEVITLVKVPTYI